MIVHTKMPYEVPNDVIMYHEKRIEWNILISACMPYGESSARGACGAAKRMNRAKLPSASTIYILHRGVTECAHEYMQFSFPHSYTRERAVAR